MSLRSLFWIAVVLGCVVGGVTQASAKALRAGVCSRDITPVSPALAAAYEARFGVPATVNHTDPVYLAGFGNGREATDFNDRIWARGVVLDSGGVRIAIVALDLVGYFVNEVETIRALVAPASAIDYLVVHSTHQHEGPDTMGLWGPDQTISGIDFGYLDFINAAVADCVDEAAAGLVKARIRYVTTDSTGLSLGLDAEDDGMGVGDGKVLVGDELLAPATEGRLVDPRLATFQLTTKRRPHRVMATLVNFASHPESLGAGNTVLTSDFPHYLRERLEAEYGGLAIWVSGDLGVLQGPLDIDVLDPVTQAPAQRRTFRWAEVHGTQLAERVIDALAADVAPVSKGKAKKKAQKKKAKKKKAKKKKAKKKPGKRGDASVEISFATTRPVPIRLDNPFFRFLGVIGALSERRQLFTDGVVDTSTGAINNVPGLLGEDLHTEVAAFRVGKGSFAVVPGELDPQIGEVYRERMVGAEHTFIIGLGNDEIGYQLPKEKWDNSCHACALFAILGDLGACPIQPVDCGTVFNNNVGQDVDPTISGAILPLIDALH